MIGKFWMLGFRWTYQSGGRYTPIVDLVPSSSHPNVFGARLRRAEFRAVPRLIIASTFARNIRARRSWGYWKFYVDVLNAYDQKNVTGYEYAPNGKNLISPPPGYGPHVPVTKTYVTNFFHRSGSKCSSSERATATSSLGKELQQDGCQDFRIDIMALAFDDMTLGTWNGLAKLVCRRTHERHRS